MAKNRADKGQTPASDPQQQLVALAFSTDGKLLSTGKVSSEVAYFDLDQKELRNARVFILPEPKSGRDLKSMTLQQLEQRTTFEPQLSFNADGGIVFEQIPDVIFDNWWWNRCCVRGRITNRASIEGQYETYPVCDATVHICEVDLLRFWIERIPPSVLERLRHGLIERIPVPQPPFPDGPFGNRLPEIPQPIPWPDPVFTHQNLDAFTTTKTIQQPASLSLQDSAEFNQLRYRLQQVNYTDFRQLLVDEYLKLRPLFCYFPYIWPYIYLCEEVAVVKTDNNGRYEACFWYQNDQPDVYVWVEYPLTTGLETVYRPNIACHTRWNYACGTDLNIYLYDSRIPPVCGVPLEGTSVAIRSIGHSVSPMAIEQDLAAEISLPGKTQFKTVGLTNYATSGLNAFSPALVNQHVRPYTGDFPIVAQFGNALPNTGIQYFQIQYRRTHSAVLGAAYTSWKALDSGEISRRYSIQVGLDFQYKYYTLNADSVGGKSHLYRIPPLDPQLPGIDGIPASTDPTARWSRYDRVRIGQVDTSKLEGDGLYEFRVRFLDGSGNLADVNADFFRVPNPSNPNVTMAAPPEYIRTDGGDAVFQFRLRIDNQQPNITIEGVSLDGDDSVMTDCGFVEYNHLDQQVGITFSATHPHDFALWSFNLERGRRLATANHFALGDASGIVTGDKPPYILDTDHKYKGSFLVRHLLLGCGDKAAFSETLSIVGLHTDGYHAGNFFRRSLSNAFALAPE